MVVSQGDVLWAELGEPRGSEAAFRRPIVVVQGNALNRSRLQTVVSVPLTTNLRRSEAAGNVVIRRRNSGLPADSVAIVSQIFAADRGQLLERIGRVTDRDLARIMAGIDIVLGRG